MDSIGVPPGVYLFWSLARCSCPFHRHVTNKNIQPLADCFPLSNLLGLRRLADLQRFSVDAMLLWDHYLPDLGGKKRYWYVDSKWKRIQKGDPEMLNKYVSVSCFSTHWVCRPECLHHCTTQNKNFPWICTNTPLKTNITNSKIP